jgi:hypothetical protein
MATGRIGTTPVLQVRWSKAPSAGTTSLSGLDDNSVSLVYSVGYEAVYRNGVLLSRTNDYTATNGTTVTLIDATIAGDIIEIFANQTIPLSDTYSQTVANGKFINNTLTTTTGDIIYASAANTPARLGIGSTDQVLKVSGGIPAWGAPAGGMTLINTGGTTLTGASVTIGSIPATYYDLQLVVVNYLPATDGQNLVLRVNNDSNANRHYNITAINTENSSFNNTYWEIGAGVDNATAQSLNIVRIFDYANTTTWKMAQTNYLSNHNTTATNNNLGIRQHGYNQTGAISSIVLLNASGNFTSGTAYLYGVK